MGIRVRKFLGLQDPDPDPLVRGADPEPSLYWNNACKTGILAKNESFKTEDNIPVVK